MAVATFLKRADAAEALLATPGCLEDGGRAVAALGEEVLSRSAELVVVVVTMTMTTARVVPEEVPVVILRVSLLSSYLSVHWPVLPFTG